MTQLTALPRLSRLHLPCSHALGQDALPQGIGIVHLGLGNFHRAHQALFTEEAMRAAGGDWGICGVTLLDHPEMQQALAPQDNLYSVLIRDRNGEEVVLGQAIQEVLVLPRQPAAVMARLLNPATRIVSLTVTEKGYCYDANRKGLDLSHPLIQQDLAQPEAPRSVPGLLVLALRGRRSNPFTVLSCDNLAHNGKVLRQVVIDYAQQLDPELAQWIAHSVKFPSTMVDRIAPATTDADRAAAARALGVMDAWPVPCEAFRQWVIEDDFSMGRPAWDLAGATLVDDVIPYELAKLRMLNGTHSTIAYLSLLAGFETVNEAIAWPPLNVLIRRMMTDEIAPMLQLPASFDRLAYRDQLLDRYANPALKHRTAQIAMDGSMKLPPRLLQTVAERLAAGLPITLHALAIAAWMRCWAGRSDSGATLKMSDPMAARLLALVDANAGKPVQLMADFLMVREIFPAELAAQTAFCSAISKAFTALDRGARAVIALYAAGQSSR